MSVKRRWTIACAITASALLASPGAAYAGGVGGSAGAVNSGAAGCGTYTCWAEVGVQVSGYSPSVSSGSSNSSYVSADVAPPACWYGPPLYSPKDFWNTIVEGYVANGPGGIGGVPTGWSNIITTAEAQKKGNFTAQGTWYSLDFSNPVTSAGTQCGATLGAWWWAPAGAQPLEPKIDTTLLAQYALSKLPIPGLTVYLNPKTTSEVDLATFVKTAPINGAAANGEIYATAYVPLTYQTVTVALTPSKLSVSGTGGQSYSNCGIYGSSESAQQMNAAGAGTPPDCGMLYQQPSTGNGFALTVTRTWTATAYQGAFVPGETGTLLNNAILPALQSTSTVNVPVREIQTSNNG
jgi:hypothetical protein